MKRTEDVLKEIKEALEVSKESKKVVNEALAHAFSTIQKMHNDAAIEYERGSHDAWMLARNIGICKEAGGYSNKELLDIFGSSFPSYILHKYCYSEALDKIKDYEKKKKEEQKLVRGDEVIADGGGIKFKGIFCGENNEYYWVMAQDEAVPQKLPKHDVWVITKTGKHIDIFGGINE